MTRHIDYDRGVMIRSDQKTGVDIFMYKDTPGVFLSAFGREVSPDLARQAGFPVDELMKKREIQLRMVKAEELIRAELELASGGRKVVFEQDGYQVIDLGMGRHQVLAPDGALLTKEILPLDVAQGLVKQLAPLPAPSETQPEQVL